MMDLFDKQYDKELAGLEGIDFKQKATMLGLDGSDDDLMIPFFGERHQVTRGGIKDSGGKPVTPAVGVVLMRYLFNGPLDEKEEGQKVSFKELGGSGPLVNGFASNTNKLISTTFSGRLSDLENACRLFNGQICNNDPCYDLAAEFQALPGLYIYLKFNDKDSLFPAQATILFDPAAGRIMDLRSLFVIGTFFAGNLIKKRT